LQPPVVNGEQEVHVNDDNIEIVELEMEVDNIEEVPAQEEAVIPDYDVVDVLPDEVQAEAELDFGHLIDVVEPDVDEVVSKYVIGI